MARLTGIRALMTVAIVAMIAAVAITPSCNTAGCLDNRSAIPLAELCGSEGKPVIIDSLEIIGVDSPGDSVLSGIADRASQVYLPMRSTRPSTAWCFAYKQKALDYPELRDTVKFDYESIPYFASEECGATYRYRITHVSCTDHLIDSVRLTDSLVTNVDRVYIRIYFRTATPGEGDEI